MPCDMTQKPVIIVTGAEGQLAQALKNQEFDAEMLFFTKTEFDLSDFDLMEKVFINFRPVLIINTAAYTKVDEAETNRDAASKVNTAGVGLLAALCYVYQCKLIHISTDYVFDGDKQSPYKEDDKTNPKTVYGWTKYFGENMILSSQLPVFAIIRTSWLYSQYGHNFYKTMLRLAETKSELKVVNDQTGCPTNANDLAAAIVKVAFQLNQENSGIYHYCNEGETTWYGFAKAIFEKHKLPVTITPLSSSEFPTAAKRPRYSVLDSSKIKSTFKLEIPSWKTALRTL
jgi:dTDP-4-dehydrorhamnose reductase